MKSVKTFCPYPVRLQDVSSEKCAGDNIVSAEKCADEHVFSVEKCAGDLL
jgi:hypothetical protein